MMPLIYVAESPDPSLAWLIYALLAFLLIIVLAGAIIGPHVRYGGAPGALPESAEPDRAVDHASGDNLPAM